MSCNSIDSPSVTISSSSNSANYINNPAISTPAAVNNSQSIGNSDAVEPGVGGVPSCFLGITPAYLWQTQLQRTPLSMVLN